MNITEKLADFSWLIIHIQIVLVLWAFVVVILYPLSFAFVGREFSEKRVKEFWQTTKDSFKV